MNRQRCRVSWMVLRKCEFWSQSFHIYREKIAFRLISIRLVVSTDNTQRLRTRVRRGVANPLRPIVTAFLLRVNFRATHSTFFFNSSTTNDSSDQASDWFTVERGRRFFFSLSLASNRTFSISKERTSRGLLDNLHAAFSH